MPASGAGGVEASRTASTAVTMRSRYLIGRSGPGRPARLSLHAPQSESKPRKLLRIQSPACASVRALVAAGARGDRTAHRKPPGRVVIDIPPSSRRPSSAYPSRAVAPAQLAPPTEVENVVVYLKDAPAGTV